MNMKEHILHLQEKYENIKPQLARQTDLDDYYSMPQTTPHLCV